jgi:hypothetical protein
VSDAYTATRRVADALAAGGIPYAIGGSIAMAVSGYARATIDGDINIFVGMEHARPALEALAAAGLDVDVDAAARAAAERGDGRLHVDGIRVDLFFDSIPLHHDAARRVATVWLGDKEYPALSPEDLTVLKAMFNRGKDWVDIERIVAAMGAAFDGGYARTQLGAHLGADDPAVCQLDRILAVWQAPDGEGARRLADAP